MNRLQKIAILETAFNHHRWVRLVHRNEVSKFILVPYFVSIKNPPSVLELWTADSPESKPEDLIPVCFGLGELDALQDVELLENEFCDSSFETALQLFMSQKNLEHLRFS